MNRRTFVGGLLAVLGLGSASSLLNAGKPSKHWRQRTVDCTWIPTNANAPKGGAFLAHCKLEGDGYSAPASVPSWIQSYGMAMAWARSHFNNPTSPGFVN